MQYKMRKRKEKQIEKKIKEVADNVDIGTVDSN